MITDTLIHQNRYSNLHPLLPRAFSFLSSLSEKDVLYPGGYLTLNGGATVAIQHYQTADPLQLSFEVHEKHIDLQYIFLGREAIQCCGRDDLISPTAYSAQKDCQTAANAQNIFTIPMFSQQFLLLFPGEAHKPKCILSAPSEIIKIIIKLPVT